MTEPEEVLASSIRYLIQRAFIEPAAEKKGGLTVTEYNALYRQADVFMLDYFSEGYDDNLEDLKKHFPNVFNEIRDNAAEIIRVTMKQEAGTND